MVATSLPTAELPQFGGAEVKRLSSGRNCQPSEAASMAFAGDVTTGLARLASYTKFVGAGKGDIQI